MEDSRAEITKLRSVMDALHLKHKEMAIEIGTARDHQAKDQSEIKRLAGMCTHRFVWHLINVGMQTHTVIFCIWLAYGVSTWKY